MSVLFSLQKLRLQKFLTLDVSVIEYQEDQIYLIYTQYSFYLIIFYIYNQFWGCTANTVVNWKLLIPDPPIPCSPHAHTFFSNASRGLKGKFAVQKHVAAFISQIMISIKMSRRKVICSTKL